MSVTMDQEVEAVARFMETHFEATKLVSIAEAVSGLAPVLWGRFARAPVNPLALVGPIPSAEQKPASANR
jgi:hypothetical protein